MTHLKKPNPPHPLLTCRHIWMSLVSIIMYYGCSSMHTRLALERSWVQSSTQTWMNFILGLQVQEFLNSLEPDMLGTDYCFHHQDIKSPNKKFTSFLRWSACHGSDGSILSQWSSISISTCQRIHLIESLNLCSSRQHKRMIKDHYSLNKLTVYKSYQDSALWLKCSI